MKLTFSAVALTIGVLAVAATLRSPRPPREYDVVSFGGLPTLVNGRIKPLDTVARTSLLTMQGRQRVTAPDGRSLSPEEWLLDVLFAPAVADHYPVFAIVHPEVLALLSLSTAEGAGGKRFSLHQIFKQIAELDRQAKLADNTESPLRTPFQRAVIQLRNNVVLYQRLQNSLSAASAPDFLDQLGQLEQNLAAATRDEAAAKSRLALANAFNVMDTYGYLRPVPPPVGGDAEAWKTAGAAWSDALGTLKVDPVASQYAALGRAWKLHQPAAFNEIAGRLRSHFEQAMPAVMTKCRLEHRFNVAQPFYTSATLYVVAFLLGVFSWLKWAQPLARAAFGFVSLAFVLTSAGILARMWLEGRPPVTNLYSSALFVGWAAVALCLILERTYRNAIGSVAASLIGFATLVIAHHLSLGGDTMEMMRAVLDSNFWLASHVVTIAVGYSATFLAGFLALIYVLRGVFTRGLDAATAHGLSRMIYGIVCFATLFSFVGTVLGGIWADQSWGRFWGWDPKENGALLIVMWTSLILHARWAGLVQGRGLAVLAIFGNIVTAWSWFGVNMLGVGLHSYGFMDAAFWWLVAFVTSQLAVMLIAALPRERWRSFVAMNPVPAARAEKRVLATAGAR